MTLKEAVSSCQPVRPWSAGKGEGEPEAVSGGGGKAECDYVTDKDLVLGLNKGARTYVISAINTVI